MNAGELVMSEEERRYVGLRSFVAMKAAPGAGQVLRGI